MLESHYSNKLIVEHSYKPDYPVVPPLPHSASRMASDERSRRGVVLIVADVAGMLRASVEELGFEAVVATTGAAALERFHQVHPAVILLDYDVSDIPGRSLLQNFREIDPGAAVVVLATAPELPAVVDAMRAGAQDFLRKSPSTAEVRRALERVRDQMLGSAPEVEIRRGPVPVLEVYHHIFRGSAKMRAVEHVALQAADTDVPVLVRGEPGVGKELVAQAVHQLSARGAKPWVKVKCAALPVELLEAELFGKLALARDGTVFLDEVAELPLAQQAKLAHVLETGQSSSVRGPDAGEVNVRFIASTSRDLAPMVAGGAFRSDLYYRLDIVSILVPPLRDRREEIAPLAQYFLEKFERQFGRQASPLSSRVLELLVGYFWPGNVRELENVMKRYVVLGGEAGLIDELLARSRVPAREPSLDPPSRRTLDLELGLRHIGRRAAEDAENVAIREALERTHGNRAEAARLLKVSYKTLLNKLSTRGRGRGPGSAAGRF